MTTTAHITESKVEDLVSVQEALEEECRSLGRERFLRRLRQASQGGRGSEAGAAQRLLNHGIQPLEKAIRHLCEQSSPGRRSIAVGYCQAVGPGVTAYLTLRVVLNSLAGHATGGRWRADSIVRVALDVAQCLLDEIRARSLKEHAPGLFNWATATLNTRSYTHKARVFNAALRHRESTHRLPPEAHMDDRTRVLIGTKLIDLLIHSTDLVRKTSKRAYRRGRWTTDVALEPTPETIDWLRSANDRYQWLHPVNLPLVIPPLKWSPGQAGGYHFALRGRHLLVRAPKDIRQSLAEADMPEVYDGLNTLQLTPWRINGRVLQLVHEIVERGVSRGGIPAFERELLPSKPTDIDSDETVRRKWRKAAHAVHERNHERRGKALSLTFALSAADRMKDFERFYFAWNLDFRGRLYPIADYLSPHGNDASRALLTFATGKPLGESGVRRLAIHGVNMLSVDPQTGRRLSTLPFEERIDWVQRHTEDIAAVAEDPWSHRWWEYARAPLQFYAFCIEWSKYREHGPEYVCSLPVAIDGSCNGIQHIAAILRDEPTGREVNLLPSRRPADLYETIAGRTQDALIDAAQDTSDEESATLASQWLNSGLVTRDLAKGPAMTFGFGARRYGFVDQLRESLTPEEKLHFEIRGEDGSGKACHYLAHVLWSVMEDSLQAPSKTMAWHETLARMVTKTTNRPLRWTSPTGFPVVQAYFERRHRQIRTQLAGAAFKPRIAEATENIDVRKQVAGVTPNLIHSLDAAALVKTVNLAEARGITSFLMIHDSYATVPADVEALGHATREAFVRMYEEADVLAGFYQACRTQYTGEEALPKPPKKGALRLKAVLESEYFFA